MRLQWTQAAIVAVICLAGCGTREYERGAIAHVYTIVEVDDPGMTVAIVPCPDDLPALVPNVAGGHITVSVDKRQFQEWWGMALPSDQSVTRRLRPDPVISNEDEYRRVMASFNRVRDLLDDQGVQAGLDLEVVKHCADVLGTLGTRLMDAAMNLEATDVAAGRGHDVWVGMDDCAKVLQTTVRLMSEMPAVATVEQHSSSFSDRIVESSDLLVAIVQQRHVGKVVNALRGVEISLDLWESNSLPGLVEPSVPANVRADVTRALFAVRWRLIECAKLWKGNLLPSGFVESGQPLVLYE